MSGAGEDRDLFAGEFVLGLLEGEELTAAEALVASDPNFARAADVWRERFNPLALSVEPVAPPARLWQRIETSTGGNVVPLRRWRAIGIGSLAVAASLAAFIVLRPPEPAQVAVLAPIAGGVPVLLATWTPRGAWSIRPNGAIAVPSGKDLELWSLAAGETKPRSLGVLPADGRRLTASLAPGTQILVSLEPTGGSPTGQPTGPVLYGGSIGALN